MAPVRLLVLSPHYDDAAYSLGGLLHQQARAGHRVVVVTVCGAGPQAGGGVPPLARELHARWIASAKTDGWLNTAAAERAAEDAAALAILGVEGQSLDIADCIYRRDPATAEWLCPTEESLFAGEGVREPDLARRIAAAVIALAGTSGAEVLAPLGIGNHVDHRLARRAAEMAAGPALVFYEDYPYAAAEGTMSPEAATRGLVPRGWPLEPDDLDAWTAAAQAYTSQVSTFWPSPDALAAELGLFAARRGTWAGAAAAVRTWRRPP